MDISYVDDTVQSSWKLTGIPVLPSNLRQKIDQTPGAGHQIAGFNILNTNFYPQESHLITFRDPWSFPILYNPACNQLVAQHLHELSDKVGVAKSF